MNNTYSAFKDRPPRVEAMHLLGSNAGEVAAWCGGHLSVQPNGVISMLIDTPEGEITAHFGDWIVKGLDGTLEAVPEDVFYTSYYKESVV